VYALVEVPAGVRHLMFMAAVVGQLGEADRCWFDDAALAEIRD
jgi:hypothetical protein